MPPVPTRPSTRRRSEPYPTGKGVSVSIDNSWYSPGWHNRTTTSGANGSYPVRLKGHQVTVSEGHAWPPKKGAKGDVGGDFYTKRQYIDLEASLRMHHLRTAPRTYRTMGTSYWTIEHFCSTCIFAVDPSSQNVNYPNSADSSDQDLLAAGTIAIARCKPTNSVADLSVFLGETVKEGLPSLIGLPTWKEKTRIGKGFGSEFLNIEFGWKPFISELRKLASGILSAQKLLAQYEKNAGRPIRRSYEFPLIESSSEMQFHSGTFPTGLWGGVLNGAVAAPIVRSEKTTTKRWFSGSFTYHLPADYDSRKQVDRLALTAEKILGLELTPSVLWDLMPWSWLIDWFTNAGDVLSNVSDAASDGLVMHYGYIMEHSVRRHTYSMPEFRFPSDPSLRVPDIVFTTSVKRRLRAHPYGFGFVDSDLSSRQLAILAALGITRR